MNRQNLIKLLAAVLMLGAAGLLFFRFLRNSQGASEKAFFYDLSEKKLFTAPRTAVPPIKGINNADEDAVRAVVVTTTGNPRDKSSWKIVYLERYSPELKQQMEAAQASGGSPPMGRGLAQAHRFVRRLTDAQWFPMNSSEAEQVVNEWARLGPDGVTPIVCTP
ncbi:MAG: hypothetical protein AAB466_14250 [Verrucomicrobiota bacterium]